MQSPTATLYAMQVLVLKPKLEFRVNSDSLGSQIAETPSAMTTYAAAGSAQSSLTNLTSSISPATSAQVPTTIGSSVALLVVLVVVLVEEVLLEEVLVEEVVVEVVVVGLVVVDVVVTAADELGVTESARAGSSLLTRIKVVTPPMMISTASTTPMINPVLTGGLAGGPCWNPGCCQAGCP